MPLNFPGLTHREAHLSGEWVGRARHKIWEGSVTCDEAFVILITTRFQKTLAWAKSLPSRDNSIDLKFQLYPTSYTEPDIQFMFSAGRAAFIQHIAATLPARDYCPPIETPSEFKTGALLLFVKHDTDIEFSLACFTKSDVVVRRNYVWGLKPKLLDHIAEPWRRMLEKGRAGSVG